MKIIKNFLIAFFVLLMCNNAFSQNNIVNDADFSPPNSALQNGKIIVQTHTNQESITLALNLVRWAGSESKQLEAEGYFILDINSSELILSDVVTFSNSDFSPSYAIISQPKFIPITFKANLVKIGTVKFKFREKTNGAWTAYRYSSKNFTTAYYIPPVVTPVTEISGPDNLCTEATYTITNPGAVTLENAVGIATLTALSNNQWKVTRTGQANGTIKLTSTLNGIKSTKDIKIGAIINGEISGISTIFPGKYHDYTLILNDNIANYQNITFGIPDGMTMQILANNKVRLTAARNYAFAPGETEHTVTLNVTATIPGCGIASIEFPITVINPNPTPIN